MDPDKLAGRISQQLEYAGPRPERPAPSIPGHELYHRIGAGSYGEVWLARGVTENLYAIKVVWRESFSSDRPFEREFGGIAQFEPISRAHPGVVNVLHVGRDNAAGFFYYVMELADDATAMSEPGGVTSHFGLSAGGRDGRVQKKLPSPDYVPHTLRTVLRARGRLPVAEVLALGVRLADALGHLHRHGLVHRDVKPSNVIFVNGQAKLADIGLVAGLDAARSFVGTEGFIPPEGPGTVRADIFGLGRLLYEAATGKDRCEFPDLPADLDQWPDRAALLELNEILARACAPDPVARHSNTAALAGDLNMLLSGRSIRHAYGIERRLKRASLVASLALGLALLTAGGVWLQRAQRQQADQRAAHEALLRRQVEQSEQTSRERLRESLLQQALALTLSSEPDRRKRALAALQAAAQIRSGKDLRDAAVAALATPELRVTRRWNPDSNEAKGTRPDPTLNRYLRCRADGGLEILRLSDDAQLLRLPAVGTCADFGYFSTDGQWLAVKYNDASVRVWNLNSRTNLLLCLNIENSSFSFLPDNSAILAGQDDGDLVLVDLQRGTARWRRHFETPVSWLAVHPAGQMIGVASGTLDSISFLRVQDGVSARTLAVPGLGLLAAWSADGKQFITTHDDFSIRLWDWPDLGSPRTILREHRSEPSFLAMSPSGRWLASSGWEHQIYWVDSSDGRLLLTQPGGLVFSAEDRQTFLWGTPSQWTLADFDPAVVPESILLPHREKGPRMLAFSPDAQWLASAGPDGVWSVKLHSQAILPVPVQHPIRAIAFGADSRTLNLLSDRAYLSFRRDGPGQGRWVGQRPVPLAKGLELELAEFATDSLHWVGLGHRQFSQERAWYTGEFQIQEAARHAWITPRMEFPAISPDATRLAWGNWGANGAYLLDLGSNSPPVTLSSEG
ncbi:MAG TPA: serine/threonine-protein kinase, partial [Verrucomicrobiae bacterium]|nr:serine/threonine-protein kinase [Verrucomicrobiae bacterium]